jgi:hypothetical protein
MVLSYFERVRDFDPRRATELDYGIEDYINSGDIKSFCESFFKAVIQKFPGAFFRDANESFYRGLFFHILYDAMEKTNYDVYSEFQTLDGQVDFFIKTHPGAKVPCKINDIIEIKRVKSSASDAEFESMFKEAIKQAENRRRGELAECRPVAICFRGNKDTKISSALTLPSQSESTGSSKALGDF